MRLAGYTKTAEHSSFSSPTKAAKLENVLGLATVVATLLRVRARTCAVLACIAAMLCMATIASANPSVQPKTCVWDFEFAEPLNTCLIHAASPRLHLENQSDSTELASASPHAARAAPGAGRVLWSGPGTRAAAEAYAKANGLQTLGQTLTGRLLDFGAKAATRVNSPWLANVVSKGVNAASARFAGGAQGSLLVFRAGEAGSTYIRYELPALSPGVSTTIVPVP